jgi:hypothetical protein
MGGVVHLTSFRAIDREEKFSTTRAALASSANLARGNNTICSMHDTLQGCPDDLVFNLDEVGISDWENRKPKKVIAPVTVAAHCSQHSPSNISERETHFDHDVR